MRIGIFVGVLVGTFWAGRRSATHGGVGGATAPTGLACVAGAGLPAIGPVPGSCAHPDQRVPALRTQIHPSFSAVS